MDGGEIGLDCAEMWDNFEVGGGERESEGMEELEEDGVE